MRQTRDLRLFSFLVNAAEQCVLNRTIMNLKGDEKK